MRWTLTIARGQDLAFKLVGTYHIWLSKVQLLVDAMSGSDDAKVSPVLPTHARRSHVGSGRVPRRLRGAGWFVFALCGLRVQV